MNRKISRRSLASALAAPSALAAQQPSAAPVQTGEELLRAAREQVQRNSEQLGKYQVPMSMEPTFSFKA